MPQGKSRAFKVLYKITAGDARLCDSAEPARPHKEGWQLWRIRQAFRICFPPDGLVPANLTDKQVIQIIEPVFDANRWKLPKVDSIARARPPKITEAA